MRAVSGTIFYAAGEFNSRMNLVNGLSRARFLSELAEVLEHEFRHLNFHQCPACAIPRKTPQTVMSPSASHFSAWVHIAHYHEVTFVAYCLPRAQILSQVKYCRSWRYLPD